VIRRRLSTSTEIWYAGCGDCLPGKEENLSASLPGAIDVALALHQLLHALQVQACMHRTSSGASKIVIAQTQALTKPKGTRHTGMLLCIQVLRFHDTCVV
jgi:hypothetical protein